MGTAEIAVLFIFHFPDSEWLVGTIQKTSGYYEKIGFKIEQGVFLSLSSK